MQPLSPVRWGGKGELGAVFKSTKLSRTPAAQFPFSVRSRAKQKFEWILFFPSTVSSRRW